MLKKIICIHVFNGYTGSPNILANIVDGLFTKNYRITLVTSLNNKGFLSDINCENKKISHDTKQNIFESSDLPSWEKAISTLFNGYKKAIGF